MGERRNGKALAAAALAAVALATAAGLLAAQPGGWIGAPSGDGEAAVPDAWPQSGDAAFAGLLPGYAFAQSVALNLTAAGSIAGTLELDGAQGIAVFESGGRTYAAVAAYTDNGVQILDVTDPSGITATDSIGDTRTLELSGASGIATFTSGGSTYAAVAAANDDGVQILDITDPSAITAAGSTTDDGSLELDGASGIAVFESGGSTYAAVAAYNDDGVQVLDITDPYDITAAGSIADDAALELDGARGIATFTSGGSTYAAVAAFEGDGVQILDVTNPSAITAAGSATDDGALELDGATGITTFTSGGRTYAAVAAGIDDGVQILDITDPSAITAADGIDDTETLELDGADGITTFTSGGSTYAAVTTYNDDGVQILDVTDPYDITAAGSIGGTALELDGASGIAVFESGGSAYAAVAAYNDDGVQILDVTDPSAITAADGIDDTKTLELDNAHGIATFTSGGSAYAAVAAFSGGVQILDITDPSAITAAGSIDATALKLDGASGIVVFESGGSTYAAVAAFSGGVQILDITDPYDITAAGNITDTTNLELDGARGIATFTSGGSTYAAVASIIDDGVQILDVTDPYDITAAGNITDTTNLELGGALGIATFTSGGSTYAAVAAANDDGVQILDITDPSAITAAGSIGATALKLDGASGIVVFESGGSTYAAVAAYNDGGVQVLDITDPYDITAAGSIDGTALELDGARGIATFTSGGSAYAAVAAYSDDGVQILDITDPHDITAAGSATDDAALELDGASGIATFTSGGSTYAAVAAANDDGVQILRLAGDGTFPVTSNSPPTVTSIVRSDPADQATTSRTLVFAVTFSEDVAGVDAGDFALSPDSTGGGSGSGQFTQTSEPATRIADRSTIQDAITVDRSGTATSVSVAVDITHTYRGDLVVYIVAPDGTARALHSRTGGSANDIDRTYAPDLDGTGIAGDWTLRVSDRAGGDVGTLNGWTLTIGHGTAGSPVTGLTGSGSVYYTTVSAAQDGTYNLDLVSSGHGIADTASNPLTDAAPTGADHTYTVSATVTDSTAPTLASIERYSPADQNTDSQTLVYKVTFSEDVTGVDTGDFVLSQGSAGAGSTASLTGSGSVYYATVSAAQDGTYNLDLVSSGHGIADAADNPLSSPAPTGADHTYTVSAIPADATAPTVASIERSDPADQATTSRTLVFAVTFSEDVTGVDLSDFALSPGSAGGGSGSGQFTQTSEPATRIADRSTIQDAITVDRSGTATSVSVAVDISHTYRGDLVIDLIAPDGTARTLHSRTGGSANDIDRTYAPDFDGTGIAGDWTLRVSDRAGGDVGTLNGWTLTIGHGGAGSPVTGLAGSGSQYLVTVSAARDGTYNLDLVSSGHGIADTASNPLIDTAPTGADHTYTVSATVTDSTAPTLASIERSDPSGELTPASTLVFEVTFSEAVQNVDAGDFELSGTGAGSITVSAVSGDTYNATVAVNTDGTFNLNIAGGHNIEDLAGMGLSSVTPTGADQSYTVDRTAPSVTSIVGNNPSGELTSEPTLVFEVTFSEDVTGVNQTDFVLSSGGTGAGSVTNLAGSGSQYLVSVSAARDGTYNLDVTRDSGITDAADNPLSSPAPTGADHTYTVSAIPADATAPTVASIERSDPADQATTSRTLVFAVTFSEDVTGVDLSDFALSPGSTGGGSGSGQFTQTSEPATRIADRSTIQDAITVDRSGTATSVSVAVDISHTYRGDLVIDLIAPDGTARTLHSRTGGSANDIDRTYTPDLDGTGIAGGWTLRVSDRAGGDVGTLNGWTLTIGHGTAGSPVTGLTGFGSQYLVSVSAARDGTYNLDVTRDSGITDAADNPLSSPATTGADHTYTVSAIPADATAPTVTSIERNDPAGATTSGRTLVFAVTFSEDVTGVDLSDFALSPGSAGGGSGSGQFTQTSEPATRIADRSTIQDAITVDRSGTATSVSVAVDISHTYRGDLVVDLIAPDGTARTLHSRAGGSANDIGRTYTPDLDGTGIAGDWTLRVSDRAGGDTGTLNSWTLTIGHGTAGSPVTGLAGSGSQYLVTVSAARDGTYNLDLVSSGHGIADTASNPLTDTVPTTGTDHTYTVSTGEAP